MHVLTDVFVVINDENLDLAQDALLTSSHKADKTHKGLWCVLRYAGKLNRPLLQGSLKIRTIIIVATEFWFSAGGILWVSSSHSQVTN